MTDCNVCYEFLWSIKHRRVKKCVTCQEVYAYLVYIILYWIKLLHWLWANRVQFWPADQVKAIHWPLTDMQCWINSPSLFTPHRPSVPRTHIDFITILPRIWKAMTCLDTWTLGILAVKMTHNVWDLDSVPAPFKDNIGCSESTRIINGSNQNVGHGLLDS